MKRYVKSLPIASLAAAVLLITGCGSSSDTTTAPAGEWQSNLSVEITSANLKNSTALFGQKKGAEPGIDRMDLKALPAPNWGQDRLEVLFEMDGKVFNTVFQNVTEDEVQTMNLSVRTNKEGREVTIRFNGIAKLVSQVDETGRTLYTPQEPESDNRLLERMKLVDSVTHAEVPFVVAGELQSYTFTMNNDEKERRFTIVLGTEKVTVEDYTPGTSRAMMKRSARPVIDPEEKPELNLDAPLEE
jgi:hypothetical protein